MLGGEAPKQEESGQRCDENGASRFFVFGFCFTVNNFFDRVVNWMVQICLSFYEVKNKQASWFSNKIERLYWEQWYINLNVAQHPKAHSSKYHHSKVVDPGGALIALFVKLNLFSCFTPTVNLPVFLCFLQVEGALEDRNARSAALEASLREVLFQIIKFVNEKKDHVPPIPNLEGAVSFPYEITIPR